MTPTCTQSTSKAIPGPMVHQDITGTPCAKARMAQLIDQRRAAAAYLAGLDMEIAMALGDRDGAQRARKEMEAQATARRAAREACYFDQVGERDALVMQGRVANG